MVKTRAWPVKAMYILIAAALAISLIIVAAPAHKVSAAAEVNAEWERVTTPTMDGWVLAPGSVIIDYALADGGDVAYAVVYAYDEDPCDDVDVTGAPKPWMTAARWPMLSWRHMMRTVVRAQPILSPAC